MAIEELTEGSIISEAKISEYGLVRSGLGVAGTISYEKDRKRVFVEPVNGEYRVGVIYELPELK